MTTARFVVGDVAEVLASMPDDSVDLVLTSPPFWALRSYLPEGHPAKAKEIGSEPTPAAYLDTLLALTAEGGRVLASHGSLCVELGDTYAGSGGQGGDYLPGGWRDGQPGFDGSAARTRTDGNGKVFRGGGRQADKNGAGSPLDKSLCFLPALYGACLAYGRNLLTGEESPAGMWRVRNLVAWVRPNPPVGALSDKFRPATSYLTVATKARDRWFDLDAVRTPFTGHGYTEGTERRSPDEARTQRNWSNGLDRRIATHAGAPPLDWWEIAPGGYPGSHYAVWPPELCERPIEAMCPRRVCRYCGTPSRRVVEAGYIDSNGNAAEGETWSSGIAEGKAAHSNKRSSLTTTTTTTGWTSCGCPGTGGLRLNGFHTGGGWRPGIVLDPFAGSGTTLMVATGHGRDAIGIDLDSRNADLARDRLGMFLEVIDATAAPTTS